MSKVILSAFCVAFLVGCSSLVGNVAKGALSGGPSVSANVQAGKTNTQTIGTTEVNETSLNQTRPQARRDVVQSQDDSAVKADQIQSVIVNEEQPVNWPMVAGLILFPSPLGLILWPLLLRYRYRLERR